MWRASDRAIDGEVAAVLPVLGEMVALAAERHRHVAKWDPRASAKLTAVLGSKGRARTRWRALGELGDGNNGARE